MIRSISFDPKYEPQNYTPDVYHAQHDYNNEEDHDHEDLNSQMEQFTDRFVYYEGFIQKLLKENDTIYDKCIDLQDENIMVKKEIQKIK